MLIMNFKIDLGCGIRKAYVLLRVNYSGDYGVGAIPLVNYSGGHS